MDQLLYNELVRDEGLRLQAYQDVNGYWTIGIGHLLGSEQRMTFITSQECDALYVNDLAAAANLIRSLVAGFDNLDPVRQRALLNMTFNRGRHMVTSTTITPAVVVATQTGRSEDWTKVKEAIIASPWAAQVGKRAVRLANMLETGVA